MLVVEKQSRVLRSFPYNLDAQQHSLEGMSSNLATHAPRRSINNLYHYILVFQRYWNTKMCS